MDEKIMKKISELKVLCVKRDGAERKIIRKMEEIVILMKVGK